MAARLSASAVFLTYSQVGDRDRGALIEFLQGINFVQGGIACTELHADQGRHFHVYLSLNTSSRFTNARFDWDDLHPNVICISGNKKSVPHKNRIQYIKKDGDFVVFPDGFDLPGDVNETSVWTRVVGAESREDALAMLMEEKPRDAVINARQIDYFLDKKFGEKVTAYVPDFPRDSFTRVPAILDEWVMGSLGELFSSSFSLYLPVCRSAPCAPATLPFLGFSLPLWENRVGPLSRRARLYREPLGPLFLRRQDRILLVYGICRVRRRRMGLIQVFR